MRIGIVIQARLSSQRLPSKVLRSVRGRPLLKYLLERLATRNMPTVIATSDDTSDDPLAGYCKEYKIAFFRGSLTHVAERLLRAAESFGFDTFFRVCADSPLLDMNLLDRALNMAESDPAWDIITNVAPRTFPAGQSIELVRTSSLSKILPELASAEHREHATQFFYQHPERFEIRNFCASRSFDGVNFAIDTPQDLAKLEKLLSTLAREPSTYALEALAERMRLVEGLESKLAEATP